MHHTPLIRNLYASTSEKYLKFKKRLDKAIQNRSFYKLSRRKQSSLISRLRKLVQRLKSLHAQLRLAGAGAALAMTISVSSSVQAQNGIGPFVRNDTSNPLAPPVFISRPHPAAVDIDNDGDLDIFVGTASGSIQFFRNNSPTGSVTRFVEVTGSANPLNTVNKGGHAAPTFADVDGDSDFDMLLGVNNPIYDNPSQSGLYYSSSKTFFFENTGSRTNATFIERTGASNPFDGIYGRKYGASIPTFVDLDGEGDVDLFVGSSPNFGSASQFFQNQGTPTSPNFVSYVHNGLSYLYLSDTSLTFADIDSDGDKDVFAGSWNNYIRCFRSDIENTLSELTGTQNPFGNFAFGNYTSPATGDFDKDGDIDFIVASTESNGYWGPDQTNLHYIENTGNFVLAEKTGLNISPFEGVDVGREAVPVFVDLDGDNDLDVVIGSKYSQPEMYVYINTDGTYKASPNHPLTTILNGLGYSPDIIPVFADIDSDGDQDMFICRDDDIMFFRKTGGNFVNEATLFPTITNAIASEISLAFLDLDEDGDLDAFMGNYKSGQPDVLYFRNTGTATAPVFSAATPPAPFNAPPLFEKEVNFFAVDLDNDGDTDLVATETYYNGWYSDEDASRTLFFENKGNETFVEASTPILNELTPLSFTSFIDFDGDGDLDAFVGNGESFDFEQNGKVFYYENANPAPVTDIASSVLVVIGGEPTVLDPALTIVDSDNDDIVNAVITIGDYVEGDEELNFDDAIAQANGITGSFDSQTGVLTFTGRATVAIYQNLLRTVSITFTGAVPAGRKSSGKVKGAADLAQQITFQVRDTDFTLTTVSVVSLNINVVPSSSEIIIFNAISPGDNDRNQFFEIRYLETFSPENKVTIYNRWGDIVYEVSGYNNTTKKFEGRSDNGKDLPTGTYFYKIETTEKTITGYLSLKR